MEWDNGATIGYSAAGEPYENFDPSSSDVACLNFPDSNITNVVFRLSNESPELEIPGELNFEKTLRIFKLIVPFQILFLRLISLEVQPP